MKRIVQTAIIVIALFLLIPGTNARADISPEGRAQLEADWLFQCDATPTFNKVKQEIVWAREMADRISKLAGVADLSPHLAELNALRAKIDSTTETGESALRLYLAVRRVKRAIAFANPLVDFNRIVLIDNPYPKGKSGDCTDEWGHEARHRNGFMAEDGGRLLVVGLDPGSPAQNLFEGHEGSFWRPDVHHEGNKVLVSFQPEGEKSFHIYEVGADGSNLKQLTIGDYDDLDPIYTPDGHITFCTSRTHTYVRCMPMTHAFAVARCDGNGKNIYVVSRNGEPEYLPSVFFQMLDEKGRCIHTMRSFTGVMPGETRGCFGCHESKLSTRGNQPTISGNMSLAMRKGPARLTPPAWGADTSVSYLRFVQPVLDKYCARCHQDPKHKAYAKLNMTLRPSAHGWRGRVSTRPWDASPFTEPYLTLVGGNCSWGGQRDRSNLAGVFVVEGYAKTDTASLATLPPYSAFSPTSTLIKNASSGEHNEVRVTCEDLERLVAWVDLNGPYLGDEEIRAMYDPVSATIANIPAIRPRVATAPVINRFNIRQDGDTMAMCGRLKIHEDAPVVQVVTPVSPEILKEKVQLKILAARYGVGDKMIDVTVEVQSRVKGIRYLDIGKYNSLFGDPVYGTTKTLTIEYELNGVRGTATFREDTVVIIPRPKR